MVHLSLSSPLCSIRKAPELVVCGSALVLITRDIFQLRLWELEYDNNNLSITSKLSWKAIATMPQEVLEFLYADIRKFVAGGNDIYFLSKASEKMGLFNKENGSWSCFQVDDTVDAYLYDPRPDISFQ
ncbi:hypothetical protein SUGI_0539180 [Cryptomeria japonica]|nr:hypothetical protein SUGI_0539180 [Cryptomeria japonica]